MKDYQELFSEATEVSLPPELFSSVLVRVRLEQKRAARKELAFVGTLALGSATSAIPITTSIFSSLSQTSFYQFLVLIFSDGLDMLTYWREILMSLAESLPIFSITIFMTVLVVLLWSVARTARDIKIVFLPA